MSTYNALALSIGVLAAVAVWLFLGPLAGALQIWVAFVAWGAFYHCGGGIAGLRNTVLSSAFGAVLAWIALMLIFGTSIGASLGVPLWAAIVVGPLVAVLVLSANFEPLAVIPAGVYGFATMAGFSLLTAPTVPKLTAANLTNPLIVVILSLIVGALFGYVSQQIANALMGKSSVTAKA